VNWRAGVRAVVPYLATAVAGAALAYIVVAFFIFPADLGSTDIKIPNVVGLPYEDATKMLQQAGFVAARGEQRYVTGAPAGQVLGQSPLPDLAASKGTRVLLEVSRGQRTVEVPQLVGVTRQQAEIALQQAGFDVGDVIEMPSPEPRGKVLGTVPVGGSRAPLPSAISLTVSGGPAQVTVPDVVGQSFADARTLLAQLGFQVVRARADSSGGRQPGQVVSQKPAASQSVPMGSTVTLDVIPGDVP